VKKRDKTRRATGTLVSTAFSFHSSAMSSSPDRGKSLRTRSARLCQGCEGELGAGEPGPYCVACTVFLFGEEAMDEQQPGPARKRRKTDGSATASRRESAVVLEEPEPPRQPKAGRKRRILIAPEDEANEEDGDGEFKAPEELDFEDVEDEDATESLLEDEQDIVDDTSSTRRRLSSRAKGKERAPSPKPPTRERRRVSRHPDSDVESIPSVSAPPAFKTTASPPRQRKKPGPKPKLKIFMRKPESSDGEDEPEVELPFGGQLTKAEADTRKYTPDEEDRTLFNHAAAVALKVRSSELVRLSRSL